MNKFIVSTFAAAVFASSFAVTAATTTENTDDGSAIGTSDTPQVKQQDKMLDKKDSHKTMNKDGTMNNKPLGTTTGKSKNGSDDITKDGPINGTTKGTN
jgi:hypothetical protein